MTQYLAASGVTARRQNLVIRPNTIFMLCWLLASIERILLGFDAILYKTKNWIRMPLEKPPPLGHAVPNTEHAISVQMPTWRDMCDMALGVIRVKQLQQNGYPRSFLHSNIQQVSPSLKIHVLNYIKYS